MKVKILEIDILTFFYFLSINTIKLILSNNMHVRAPMLNIIYLCENGSVVTTSIFPCFEGEGENKAVHTGNK